MDTETPKLDHFMLDLETFDVGPKAVIRSIGIAHFDKQGVHETFYTNVDFMSNLYVGRTVAERTVRWWGSQSDEAKAALEETPGLPLREALYNASIFIRQINPNLNNVRMWSYGSDFDNVVISTAYEDFGMNTPFAFRGRRCYRTMLAILDNHITREGIPYPDPPESVTTHHALEDAKWQALNLISLANAAGIDFN